MSEYTQAEENYFQSEVDRAKEQRKKHLVDFLKDHLVTISRGGDGDVTCVSSKDLLSWMGEKA